MVQWLQVGTFAAVVQVQFLVRELRILQTVQGSHKKKKKKKKNPLEEQQKWTKKFFLKIEGPMLTPLISF